jgi:hypothetical protein
VDSEDKFPAPYVPFSTFETALDKLAGLGAIPPKIDHTVFPSMGGLAKGQVISAFKFLGLIDADGVPDASLKELAMNKGGRKATMRKLIKDRYPNISESDLAGSSATQLDAKLGDKIYNISGETKQKARSFLLKAAVFAEMPISKLLTTKGRSGPRKKKPKPTGEFTPISELAKKDKGGEGKGDSNKVDPANVRMPIALGPERVAYVEIPKGMDRKDAKKLLALLGLSLDIEIKFPEKEVVA